MKLLLDTNRLSDALALEGDVLDNLEHAEAVYVPAIALGEIRAGFAAGRRRADNEKRLSWFLAQDGISTLSVDAAVSHSYAELHRALRTRGRPIPTNDLWIASIALAHGLVVYTRDAHFNAVPGIACL
ncbi:MAG TPA: type II toxin-antitoxin system VapC family toxin [Polyangiaceae bacterium]|jgi:predicted nucleic acid-binding protein|nr:type II toxin-antitoxin system VapC family toxin [Polyangiaceae bacterium]